MASPFLGIASGLTQGLAGGIQQGYTIMQQRQSMAIQEQQATAMSLTALSNAAKIVDPAMRKLAFQRLLPGVGVQPDSPAGKQVITAMTNATEDSLNQASDLFKQALGVNLSRQAVGQIITDHPEVLVNVATAAAQRRMAANILSGLPNPDGTYNTATGQPPAVTQPTAVQPTGVGDMGTGTTGAGGTTTAPTVSAGTSADGTQPVVAPPAPPPVSVAAPATPAVAAPAPATAQPAVTAPAATAPATAAPATPAVTPPAGGVSQAGTLPNSVAPTVTVGQTHDGQTVTWDPYNAPYVKAVNQAIARAEVLPGDNTQLVEHLKDLRNQFVDGEKYKKQQWLEMQNLEVAKGHLAVDQYNASLNAQNLDVSKQRLGLDTAKFDYQQKHDQQIFTYNQYKDKLDHEVAVGHLTVDQANAQLNQKRLDLDLEKYYLEPRSDPGKVQWDITHGNIPGGGPTAPGPTTTTAGATGAAAPAGNVVTIPQPAAAQGKTPGQIGTSNKDGTFTITDAAVLKSVGMLNDADRLVWNPTNNSWFVQVPTPTTATTKEGINEAQNAADNTQIGINAANAVLNMADKDPTALGRIGQYKGGLQSWAAIGRDLQKSVPLTRPVLNWLGLDKIPYDPNVPTAEGLSEVLNAAVAKALTGSGAGLGAYSTGVKSTEELTDLTHGSASDIKGRMVIVRQILQDAQKMAIAHLPAGGKASVPNQPTVPVQPIQNQQPVQQPETPLQTKYDKWQTLSADERKPLIGTVNDMTPSVFPTLSGNTSHLSKIPNGAIISLKQALQKYKTAEGLAAVHRLFNDAYGNGADASVGYK